MPLFGVVGALRAVVWLSVISYPLALVPVARVGRLDPFWALLGFPAAFSFPFWFGFVNFLLVTPPAILFLVGLTRHCERPTRTGWLKLAGGAVLLFWAHGLMSAMVGLSTLLMAVTAFSSWRERLRTPLILVPATLAFLLWNHAQAGVAADRESIFDWSITRLAGMPGNVASMGHKDLFGVGIGVAVLVLPFLAAGKPSRAFYRFTPLLSALVLCLGLPFKLFGTAFLHQRFAVFLLPGVLFALDAREHPPRFYRTAVTLIAAVWIGIVAIRIVSFDAEARPFDRVLQALEPGRALRPVIIDATSDSLPDGHPFLHFGAYYQAEKGGRLGFSFARNYPSVIRYRPEVDPGMAPDAEWHWEKYSKDEAPLYDYFLFRAPLGVPARAFRRRVGQAQAGRRRRRLFGLRASRS